MDKLKSRSRKLYYNTITSLIYQLVVIVSAFIISRLILVNYGSETNGLVSSISQFIGFIALMEFGIGAVVQSSLYEPLAKMDINQISKIMKSVRKFFNVIVSIFIGYILLLILIYPSFAGDFDKYLVIFLIIILSVGAILQYVYGMSYQLLLNADQKSYISNSINIITVILNIIISIILIINGINIVIVKLASTIIFLARPAFLYSYVNRKYKLNKNIFYNKEPIKQKWNGIAQHAASFVLINTDIVVLTLLSDLKNVSIYAVYNLIVKGLKQLVVATTAGVQSLFGNMLARNEMDELFNIFKKFEWLIHSIVAIIFSCTLVLIVPFVSIFTLGIDDANYIQPQFASLLVLSVAAYCLRLPYNIIVLAAGHYKETQKSALIEMSINIVISIALVYRFGLIGVAIGTLVAMLYRTIYLSKYISSHIFIYKFGNFFKKLTIDIAVILLVQYISQYFVLDSMNYFSWIILAIKIVLVAVCVSFFINFIFFKDNIYEIIKKTKNYIKILKNKIIKN